MKPKYLFIASAVVFVLAFVVLGVGWQGKAGLNLSTDLSAITVQFCGTAHGGWALGGIVGIIVGVILFIVALIRLIKGAAVR
ncbi:MAG: hypothetical protein ACRD3T_12025 [Terriglobia bacterium]